MLRIFVFTQVVPVVFSGLKTLLLTWTCITFLMLLCADLSMLLMQEVGSGNTSQKSDEEDFVKVDDLPLQLTVMCEVCSS